MSKKTLLVGKATTEQIEAWKKEHGDVFEFEFEAEGHACYLRKPKRSELSRSLAMAPVNPLGATEIIATNCWLGGSEEIKTDDKLFLGLHMKIQETIEAAEGEVKKL